MPDTFGENGLTVSTAAEITSQLVTGLQGIYGGDINVDSNSPDGQMVGIITQIAVDLRELLVSINAGFDPDQAIGVILDQRLAINNVTRDGGQYTIQPVDITATIQVDIQGLDQNFNDPNGTGYTVQDATGNEFILVSSTTIGPGVTTLDFRAKLLGNVQAGLNTITIPVTVIPGITGVNNSSSSVTEGIDEETDPAVRVRRQRSVALATTGYLNGLQGKLLALPGVTEAAVYENVGPDVDSDGIPGHGVWIIVAGGSIEDIGQLIYQTKSYGANMRGVLEQVIVTANGAFFTAKWDTPVAEPLFIDFTIKKTIPGFIFAEDAIKAAMAASLKYDIGAFAETSRVTDAAIAAINSLGGGGVPVLVSISDDGITFTDFVETSTLASQFTVGAGNISITVV